MTEEQHRRESDGYSRGQIIAGKYRLIRRLDEGGMGTVWAAHNVDLDVHVAIKLIRAELAASGAAERLLNEARILARLEHPAIIRVHDCGRTATGAPYIVMELLSGECLADLLERMGRLDPVEAVSLLLPIIEGLCVAHDSGVVHRDIKPDNIYLSQNGSRVHPKLLDFGIALSELSTGRLTIQGSVMGSPAYMSPEQARGERDVDAATDVWAAAVVLYELISGQVPFDDENYNAVLRAIIEQEPVSLREIGIDPALAEIIVRGLSKDKDARFATVRAMGEALAQWLVAQGVHEDAARVSLRSVWLIAPPSSDPPCSIPPVTLPESSRPSAPERARFTLSNTELLLPAADVRQSTSGVSVTAAHFKPRRRWLGASLAAAALLGAGALALWARPAAKAPSVPPPVSAPALPAVLDTTAAQPRPNPVEDAGMKAPSEGEAARFRTRPAPEATADEPEAPRSTPVRSRRARPPPRPAPFRPRGP